MKKNLFLTFCFSFIPGAGQMYQGYMKRGMSILTLFATCCAILGTIGIPLFAIPIPVIYIYSFFDTFNIRYTIDSENKYEDKYIWDIADLDELKKSFNLPSTKKILGIILMFIGIYILISNILPQMLSDLGIRYISSYLYKISSYLTPIAISLLSIVIGIKLLNRK